MNQKEYTKISKIKILLLFFVGVVIFAGFTAGVSESQQATKQDKPKQIYKPVTQTKESGAAMTAQAALEMLKDGNRRFVEGELVTRDLIIRGICHSINGTATSPGTRPMNAPI